MEIQKAYLLMEDPDVYAERYGAPSRRDYLTAARLLASLPEVLKTSPGRVGRNVRSILAGPELMLEIAQSWGMEDNGC